MTGRYEMLLEQNADVPVRDGAILHANVYRPNANRRFPVLMTFGPYGKDVPLREFMQEAWDRLNKTYPEILAASSCKPSCSSGRIQKCGSRTATWSSMWTLVARANHRADSIRTLLRRFATSTTPLNGQGRSPGAAGRSGCSAFLIMPRGNGLSPQCGRRISRQFYLGRAPTTFIATAHVRTGSTQADFSNVGGTAAFCATNTEIQIPTVETSTPVNA